MAEPRMKIVAHYKMVMKSLWVLLVLSAAAVSQTTSPNGQNCMLNIQVPASVSQGCGSPGVEKIENLERQVTVLMEERLSLQRQIDLLVRDSVGQRPPKGMKIFIPLLASKSNADKGAI